MCGCPVILHYRENSGEGNSIACAKSYICAGQGLVEEYKYIFLKSWAAYLVNYKHLIESPDHKDLADLVIAVPNAQRFIMCDGTFSKLQ